MSAARSMARSLHPGAWWLWALGLATAASRTTNPVLLLLIVVVAGYVVAARRIDAPWAGAFRASLLMGGVILLIRLCFEVFFGLTKGPTVLFTLPTVALPHWAAGVAIGGAVTLEGVLGGLAQALQIATIIACIGAANALANPSRLLKAVPGALYELGVAVVVAMTLAPQAVDDVRRVRRARRLRGRSDRGISGLLGVARPVLDGSFDRSLQLAASMDARGYGRRAAVPRTQRILTSACTLGGLIGVACGAYGLLDAASPGWAGLPLLLAGLGVALGGMALASRTTSRSQYRPDPWRLAEWSTALSGAVPAAVLITCAARGAAGLAGPGIPLHWPALPLLPLAAILVGLLPAVATPPQSCAAENTPAGARASAPAEQVRA